MGRESYVRDVRVSLFFTNNVDEVSAVWVHPTGRESYVRDIRVSLFFTNNVEENQLYGWPILVIVALVFVLDIISITIYWDYFS